MRIHLAAAASAILAVGCAPIFAGSELVAQERDFLLSTPRASISLRAGVSVPRAEGGGSRPSLWDFAREQLTVETSDLTGAYLLGEIGVRASEHVDFVLAVGYTSSAVRSEYRHWVDTDDLPIEQTTEFSTTPVTVGVRYYPLPRGRQVGSYAWIPSAVGPFVGISGGSSGTASSRTVTSSTTRRATFFPTTSDPSRQAPPSTSSPGSTQVSTPGCFSRPRSATALAVRRLTTAPLTASPTSTWRGCT